MFATMFTAAAFQAAMPTGADLEAAIANVDSRLFWAAFEGCDPDALAPLLGEEFRMVHDQAGIAVPSRSAFIEGMEMQCADRPESGYKNRRLLTPGSRRVQALGEWGALEEGYHQFYEWRGDHWELTGGARYIHIWQWTDTGFVLDESISVNHGAALPYPPGDSE